MLRLRDISIRHKLLLMILITSGSALILACAAFVGFDFLSTRDALARRLVTLADVVGANSTAALSFDNSADAIETLAALRAERNVVQGTIYDTWGTPFASYHRDGAIFTPPAPDTAGYYFRENRIDVFRPILLDGENIGAIFIQSDLLELDARIRRYAQIVVVFIIISTVVAVLIGFRLRSVISDPILRLLHTMQQVTEERAYNVRADQHGDDELGRLIQGFNAMLGQIQGRDEALLEVQQELALRARELQEELTERERAEERIRASLLEKEVLLKEVHHRVKNNLQIIASLLDLQARQVEDDPAITELLGDSRNRVRSMALVHEHLYQAEDLAKINISEYLADLCRNLAASYVPVARRVRLQSQVEEVAFDVDTAIPCGLIINELVSNSLKYAFPGDADGEVTVSLRGIGTSQYELCVTDDGIGLPPEIDIDHTHSLGLQLITALTRQIHGEIHVEREGGTLFRILFGRPTELERNG